MTVQEEIIDLIPALRAYAWVLTRRHEDVDDLVQDTLVKAIDKVDSFRPGTNLRAWVITIMRNTFLNDIAKAKKTRTGSAECVSATLATPATQEWTVRGGELMDVVARLPRNAREILILVVMLGESYETAAEVFGIRIGTVKSRVNRARKMVVDQLEAQAPNDPFASAASEKPLHTPLN